MSATAVVEGAGVYPPLEVLHNTVYAKLALLLGFLFIAAVGVGRLTRGEGAKGSI